MIGSNIAFTPHLPGLGRTHVKKAAPTPSAVPESLFTLVDRGWVRPDPNGWAHWADTALKNRILCGKKVLIRDELYDVLSIDEQGPINAPCRDCITELVRQRHNVPFKVGDRVVSKAEGMTLYGIVRGLLELNGQAVLNLDRVWKRKPQEARIGKWGDYIEHDLGVHDWYRLVSECRAWVEQ